MRAVVDVADVAPYLAGRGLLSARAMVDGRLRVEDVSRKNRVFLVTADGAPCSVVKLSADPDDTGVAREAAVLERLGRRLPFLPKRVMYDRATGVLVLETPSGARDLAQLPTRGRFSLALARQAGRALAALHSLPPDALDGLEQVDPTRILAIHRPDLATVRSLSGAALDLVRLVQGSGALCCRLERLLEPERRDCVVHGDVRWDNWLALGRNGSMRRTRVLMLDWELAAAGDPAFDVGAYLAEYLCAWKQQAWVPDPLEPGHRLHDPARVLPPLQPAVSTFYDAYVRDRAKRRGALNGMLRRAVGFAGARLVLIALEEAHACADLQKDVRVTLQLGANVLERPRWAVDVLLGLRRYWERA